MAGESHIVSGSLWTTKNGGVSRVSAEFGSQYEMGEKAEVTRLVPPFWGRAAQMQESLPP